MNQVLITLGLTLLHSLWQGMLLFGIYSLLKSNFIAGNRPLARRNAVLGLLLLQMIISVGTFVWLLNSGSNLYAFEITPHISDRLIEFTLLPAAWLYLLVVCFKLTGYGRQWYVHQILWRNAEKAPAAIRLYLEQKCNHLGINRKVRLGITNRLSVPVTFGTFKPVILLPIAALSKLSMQEVETLLLHELTHIRCNDYAFNFVLVMCDTLFFFHPFLRKLAAEARLEREVNCDLNVVQHRYSTLLYAETLLKTARLQQSGLVLSVPAVSQKSELMKRITRFTGNNTGANEKSSKSGTRGFLLLTLLVAGIFVATLLRNEDPFVEEASLTTHHSVQPQSVFSFIKQAETKTEKPKAFTTAPDLVKAERKKSKEKSKPVPTRLDKVQESETITEEMEEVVNLPPAYSPLRVTTTDIPEKEMEIVEENSQTGEITTTRVKCYFINGEWVAYLLWQTSLKKSTSDSTDQVYDSIPVPFFDEQ